MKTHFQSDDLDIPYNLRFKKLSVCAITRIKGFFFEPVQTIFCECFGSSIEVSKLRGFRIMKS